MQAIRELIGGSLGQDLVWTLLHTLWQGLVLGVVLFLYLKRKPTHQANSRYLAALITLFGLLLLAAVTFSILQLPAEERDTHRAVSKAAPTSLSTPPSRGSGSDDFSIPYSAPPSRRAVWIPWTIGLWVAGVITMLARLVIQLMGIQKLLQDCRPIEDTVVATQVTRLKEALGINTRIQIVTCKQIDTPGIIGFINPILLLPLGAMTGIPADDLKAILSHELMHIKRYDYLVNFFQMVVEALLFFNPAMWWISRQIRLEREACCDAAVVQTTGQRLRYAGILLAWSKHSSQARAEAGLQVAFSKPHSHNLAERIRRIVTPNHRPQVHLNLFGIAGMLLLSILLLLALWKTTDSAVFLAAKILTPHQRIQKMGAIDANYGQAEFNPESIPIGIKGTVTGQIQTWDQQGLPPKTKVYGRWRNLHESGTTHIPQANGRFSWTTHGIVHLAVYAPGYAPSFVGPFDLKNENLIDAPPILLEKGHPTTIRVVDAQTQNPIPQAHLTGGYIYYPGGYSHTLNLDTDEQGQAYIAHAGNRPVNFQVEASGYEDIRYEKQTLPRKNPLVLEMTKAQPATGIVLSQESGHPIPGVEIRIQGMYGGRNESWGRDQGRIIGRTDAQGRFSLTNLHRDATYVLAFKAEGFQYAFLNPVRAGDQALQINLAPSITIRGKVLGSLKGFPQENGHPVIRYQCIFSYRADVHGKYSHRESERHVPIVIRNAEQVFELTDLWGNILWINGKEYHLPDDLPEPFIIDTSNQTFPGGSSLQKRKVILNFDVPAEMPAPTGTIRVNVAMPSSPNRFDKIRILKITKGSVETEAYANGRISYGLADTVGYWFKEKDHFIPVGDEPLVIKIPVIPAGLLFGEVFNHDGTPASNTLVSITTVETSPLFPDSKHQLNVAGKNRAGSDDLRTTFSIGPLPLGGHYALVAYRGYNYIVSDAVKLDEQAPIQELNLRFAEGVTLRGQVLDPKGHPARHIPYRLDFSTPGFGFSGTTKRTGPDGQISFDAINPQAKGTYRLVLDCRKDYRKVKIPITDFQSPLVVRLEKGAGVTGRILDDQTGWPIPGVQITANHHKDEWEQLSCEARTDDQGRFRFSNMKAGRQYRLYVDDCQEILPKTLEAIGGQTQGLAIRVKPRKGSRLKPRRPEQRF